MKAIPDRRPQVLKEIERALDDLAHVPLVRVVVEHGSGRTRRFVLRERADVRQAKREQLRAHLCGEEWEARVLIYEGALHEMPDAYDWPGAPTLPFAEPEVAEVSVPVRQIIVARVQVAEEFTPDEDKEPGLPVRPERAPRDALEAREREMGWHSRSSLTVAWDILAMFVRDEIDQRLTRQQIEDGLVSMLGPRTPPVSVINFTLSDMTKSEWLTNSRQKDERGMGYYPTPAGRQALDDRMIDMEG